MILTIVLWSCFQGGDSLLPTTLLDNYDKRVVPYYFTNETLIVNISLPVLALAIVHGQEQMGSFIFEICLEWIDERLKYDSRDYNNESVLYLPSSEIWTPPYNLYLALESKVLTNKRGDLVEIQPNGKVIFRETQYTKTGCGTNVDRFPFDIQYCGIEIINEVVNQTIMRFQGYKTQKHDFQTTKEFAVVEYFVLTTKRSRLDQPPDVFFLLCFERKTFYYIFVIVIPAVLITTLTITGILLPTSGETNTDPINIGLASLLALAITLTVIADNIPRTATVPLIGWFVLICIALCILSVLAGLIFGKIEEFVKKHDHLPVSIDRLMCFYQTKVTKVVRKKPSPPKETIKTLSFALFLLMQVLLFCNLMVFISFDWNKKTTLENWSQTGDMKVYDVLEM